MCCKMSCGFILLWMIFNHLIYDFHIQGWLAQGKQKSWWMDSPDYKYKYRNDYIVCLFIHSLEWSMWIMLPWFILYMAKISITMILILIANTIIHMIVDHMKANIKSINLLEDQFIHYLQIIVTLFLAIKLF